MNIFHIVNFKGCVYTKCTIWIIYLHNNSTQTKIPACLASSLTLTTLEVTIALKLILTLSAALFVSFSAVSASLPLTIHIGTEPGYAPFESKSSDGKVIGFDIDLVMALYETRVASIFRQDCMQTNIPAC